MNKDKSKRQAECTELIALLGMIIDELFPLSLMQKRHLGSAIRGLWKELTSEKEKRKNDYIGEAKNFGTYIRYFMPWNIIRLIHIFDNIKLENTTKILDIGSGPLTVIIALWIAKPELRDVELHIDCVDRVKRILDAGMLILETLAMRVGQPLKWKIVAKKEIVDTRARLKGGAYDLVCAANVFNESFWHMHGTMSERAEQLAKMFKGLCRKNAKVLLVEPGEPRSGALISAVREAVIVLGGSVIAPCTHNFSCPMSGVFSSKSNMLKAVIMPNYRAKMPWCHFAVDLSLAPKSLTKLSEQALLPKDRLTVSWLFFCVNSENADSNNKEDTFLLRIVSDSFVLPKNTLARYSCSSAGYSLVLGQLAEHSSGSLVELKNFTLDIKKRDDKSGAVIIRESTKKQTS